MLCGASGFGRHVRTLEHVLSVLSTYMSTPQDERFILKQMGSLAEWLGPCSLRAYASYTLMQLQARLSADFLLPCINGTDST
jgi:hypothetical protein